MELNTYVPDFTYVFNNEHCRPADLCSQILHRQLTTFRETDAGQGSFICKELVVSLQRQLLTRGIELRSRSVSRRAHARRTWCTCLRILGSEVSLHVCDGERVQSLPWKVESDREVPCKWGPFRRRNCDGHHFRLFVNNKEDCRAAARSR